MSKGVYVHKVVDVCNDIIYHMENKLPFAIQRLGDGYHDILRKYYIKNIKEIPLLRCFTQGVRPNDMKFVIDMMVDGSNNSNYVSQYDTQIPDFNGYYSHLKGNCIKKLEDWKIVYKKAGIINTNYTNPFIHYHLFLTDKKNLFDYIKNKRICVVCAEPSAIENLQKSGIDITYIEIPQQTIKQDYLKNKDMILPLCNEWHIDKYEEIKSKIKDNIDKCDIFLIASGLLGKGYSSYVKELGGVSVDIGKMIHIWSNKKELNVLSHGYFYKNLDGFSLNLTEKGKLLRI